MIISISSVSAMDNSDIQVVDMDNEISDVDDLKISEELSSDTNVIRTNSPDDGDVYIKFDENDVTIVENESKEVRGELTSFNGSKEFEYKCTYTDGKGVDRTYSELKTDSNGLFVFDLGKCEGLIARDDPYILTFSPDKENDMNFDFYDANFINSVIGVTVTSLDMSQDNVVYVSPDGADEEGCGSKTNPYKTINYAVLNAEDGSEIYICEGTYDENSITINKNLKLIGEGNVVITASSTNKNIFIGNSTYSYQFVNLNFQNILVGTNAAVLQLKNTGNNEIINCTFNNLTGKSVIDSYGTTNISNCVFNENNINMMTTGALLYLRGNTYINNVNITKTKNSAANGYNTVIYVYKGEISFDNLVLSESSGKLNGVLLSKDTQVLINNSRILDNTFNYQTATMGGFLFTAGSADNAKLEVTNSIISNNVIENALIYGIKDTQNFILNYDVIYNNTGYTLSTTVNPTLNFDYNYWGNNTPVLTSKSGSEITLNNYVIVDSSINPDSLKNGQQFTVNVELKLNDSGIIKTLDKSIPEIPITIKYKDDVVSSTEAQFIVDKEYTDVLITAINEEITKTLNIVESSTVYVSDSNGSDEDGLGTKDKPYKTIAYAVSKAEDNSTVYVYEGKYDENSIVLNKNLKIIGENKNVVITSLLSNVKIFEAEMDSNVQLKFENLTFDNIIPGQLNGILNIRNTGKNEILNCVFRNCGGQYIIWSSSNETIIDNCEFINIQVPTYGLKVIYLTGHGNQSIVNTKFDTLTNPNSGIADVINMINSPNNLTIDDILVTGISGKFEGINIGDTSSADPNNVIIKNSKFIDNELLNTTTKGGVLIYGVGRANIEITNSIIADNIVGNGLIGGSSNATVLTLNYNVISGNEGYTLFSTVKSKPVKLYNIDYNYWGSNTPEVSTNVDELNMNKWIVVETSHSPADLEADDNVTVVAQLKVMDKEGNANDLERLFVELPITFEYGDVVSTTINNKTEVKFKVDATKNAVVINLIDESISEKLLPEIDVDVNDTVMNIDNPIIITGTAGTITVKVNDKVVIESTEFDGNLTYIIKSSDLKLGLNNIVVDYANSKQIIPGIVSKTFEVIKMTPEITVEADDLTVGQQTIITVKVANATDKVTLIVDGDIKDLELNNESIAKYTIDNLKAGQHDIIAIYEGNDVYKMATGKLTFEVNKFESNVNIAISDIKIGEDIVVTVNVPNATGNVKIIINGKENVATLENGVVSYTIEKVVAGNYSVSVIYDGDDTHNAAHNVTSFTVDKKVSSININANDVTAGQNTTVEVSVTSGATGIVEITIAGNIYVLDLSETNTLNIALSEGNYTIIGRYLGDNQFDASVSEPINVVVNPKESEYDDNITIPIDIKPGESSNITINLPSDATGNLSLIVDGVEVSSAEVINGTANLVLENLTAGSHRVEVKYSGDAKYAPKSSSNIITIPKIDTNIVVSANLTCVAVDYSAGERGTKVYAVLEDANGNPITNKTVQIVFNSKIYNVTTDDAGKAGLKINVATAKKYDFSVYFQGDDVYNVAPLTLSNLTVVKKKTAIKAASKTFKAKAKTKKISVQLKTIKNNNGKVYLKAGKKLTLNIKGKVYTAKINKKGVATFNIKLAKKGKYTAAIKFKGDKTYKAANKKIKVVIK